MSTSTAYTGPPARVSLQVTIHVAPTNVEPFLAALKPAFDAVTAEPECVFFEVYLSRDVPGRIKFVENWNASKEWLLEVQTQKDYYAPYFAATRPMYTQPAEIELVDRLEASEWLVVKEDMVQHMSTAAPQK